MSGYACTHCLLGDHHRCPGERVRCECPDPIHAYTDSPASSGDSQPGGSHPTVASDSHVLIADGTDDSVTHDHGFKGGAL